jgi:hypothetical protein
MLLVELLSLKIPYTGVLVLDVPTKIKAGALELCLFNF